jgi:acetyl-CoA carboxylase carboxyltransferase component
MIGWLCRRAFSQAMGGDDRLKRHRDAGKLDARARAAELFDNGTFVEIGALAGNMSEGSDAAAPADGLVAGFGRINGRPALAAIEDFTVLAGSIGDASADKRYRITQLAAQERVPLVFMLEGAGHRLTNVHAGRSPNDLQGLAELSGQVPIVSLVLGASAGHSALAAPLSDIVIMTEAASMFAAGPPIVKGAIGETVTKEELGGPQVHVTASGVAHNLAKGDREAIAMARAYLSYFPLNAWQATPQSAGEDCGPRLLDEILDLVSPDSRIPFDVRKLLEMLVDADSLFEVQPSYGGSLVTALARVGGRSVAIVANNPIVRAGAVDAASADKASHFLEVAGAFHLPVIFLTDNPGVMPGSAAERSGVLRHAARMFVAQHRLQVSKIHVTLRKAFGFGSSIMALNPFDGQTLSLSFPAISLGAMPASSGADAAKLDPATRARISAEQSGGAYHMANKMAFDDVIDPRQLRNAILNGLMLAEGRRDASFEPVRHVGIRP